MGEEIDRALRPEWNEQLTGKLCPRCLKVSCNRSGRCRLGVRNPICYVGAACSAPDLQCLNYTLTMSAGLDRSGTTEPASGQDADFTGPSIRQ